MAPKKQRPATLTLAVRFNVTLGGDTTFIPFGERARPRASPGDNLVPLVHWLCWGTSFHQGGIPENHMAKQTRRVFSALWVRPFGPPMRVVVDQGTAFAAEFLDFCQLNDIEVYLCPLEAPWQAARAERHGAIIKSMVLYMLDELGEMVQTRTELQEVIDAAFAAKNRLMRRGGRSPNQRVFGTDRRLPGDLLDEEDIRPLANLSLTEAGHADAVRAEQLRQSAQRAALAASANSALRRARLRRQASAAISYKEGQRCYFWRRRGKKAKKGISSSGMALRWWSPTSPARPSGSPIARS